MQIVIDGCTFPLPLAMYEITFDKYLPCRGLLTCMHILISDHNSCVKRTTW